MLGNFPLVEGIWIPREGLTLLHFWAKAALTVWNSVFFPSEVSQPCRTQGLLIFLLCAVLWCEGRTVLRWESRSCLQPAGCSITTGPLV